MLEEKKPKSWLKSISAFANGLGGSLFFGIDNDGIVKGLDGYRAGATENAVQKGVPMGESQRAQICAG